MAYQLVYEFLTVNAAAKLLDVSDATVRLYERQGRLPALRTSSGIRLFKKDDVERFRKGTKDEEVKKPAA
jgi:excisionase family DNA binding protein